MVSELNDLSLSVACASQVIKLIRFLQGICLHLISSAIAINMSNIMKTYILARRMLKYENILGRLHKNGKSCYNWMILF